MPLHPELGCMYVSFTGAIAPAYKDYNPNGFIKCQFDFRNQLCFTFIQNSVIGSDSEAT